MTEPLYILPSGDGITLSDVRSIRANASIGRGTLATMDHVQMVQSHGGVWIQDCDSFEAALELRDQLIAAHAAAASPSIEELADAIAAAASKERGGAEVLVFIVEAGSPAHVALVNAAAPTGDDWFERKCDQVAKSTTAWPKRREDESMEEFRARVAGGGR